MKKIYKYATGEAPPEGAIYLATVTQTRERDGQWVDGNYSWKECWYVWHYFLVEESEESE